MTKTILVITPWNRRWAMGRSAGIADDHYFSEGLRTRGYDVHFLCPGDGTEDPSEANYHVHRFPDVLGRTERLPGVLKRPLWIVLFTWCVVHYGTRVSKQLRPSLFIGHTQLGSWGVRWLARRFHAPSIIKLFGVVDLDRTDWSRAHYWRKNAEQILAFKVHHDAWIILDDGTRGDEAARRHGVAADRVHLLPNGVNTEWAALPVDRPAAYRRFGIAPGTKVVLFLSRLTAWKRPDLFIRLARPVLARVTQPVVFVLAGDGPFRPHCEALAATLGVNAQVRFLGPVAHEEVRDLMSITTVLASTNLRSNRGIPVCEAMVCGVPVVAFDVGDTAAIVREGETGRLIAEGDETALAGAIVDLLDDDAGREAMGRRAQAFATAHFTSWPARIDLEARILERLVDRSAARQ